MAVLDAVADGLEESGGRADGGDAVVVQRTAGRMRVEQPDPQAGRVGVELGSTSAPCSGRAESANAWAVSRSTSSATGGRLPSCSSIEREKPLSDGGTNRVTEPAPLRRRMPST